MIKLIKTFLLIIAAISLCSCTFERGLILFNAEPVTKENALQDQKVFNEGQRVYYLFIAPQKMKNEFIRVQVFKMTEDAPWGGNEVVRTKDYRLPDKLPYPLRKRALRYAGIFTFRFSASACFK